MVVLPVPGPRRRFADAAAGLGAMLGVLVLCGWALDIPTLRSLLSGAVEMKANTAVGLIAVALALWFAGRVRTERRGDAVLSAVFALMALFLGVATLCEYLLGWQLGIDERLFRDVGAAYNQVKGRMSPYSALAFCVLGLGILSLRRPGLAVLTRLNAGVAIAIGSLSIVGYLWNAVEIVTDQIAPPVALNTAIAFVLFGVGVVALTGAPARGTSLAARTRLERLVLGGFVPTALFAVVGGGVTYESGAGFARAAERVGHSQEVRAELSRLRTSMSEAETAQRNLLLTGRSTFSDSFEKRANEVRGHLATLRAMIADNPEQVRLQAEVSTQTLRRLATFDSIGSIYRSQGLRAAAAALEVFVLGDNGSNVGELLARMDASEGLLLTERLKQAERRRGLTLASLLVTLTVLITVFVLLFRGVRAEMQARTEAERALQQLNEDLERRIEERTAALSHQRSFLRRVIDLDRNLIFAKDRDGRFVLANQAIASLLSTTVEALLGQNERSFTSHTGQVEGFESDDLQVIESGQELFRPEQSFTDAKGQLHWFSAVKRPILSPDGSATIVLGVAVDITERIEAEREIRQLNTDLERRVEERTRDLRESNVLLHQARLDSEAATRAKSAFLANMSHEIRTPMNAVIGLTHLMLRESTDRTQRDRLDKVAEAAKHLLQVINDILDMSKIEAGKLVLESIEFGLDDVLSSAIAMVDGQARAKGLELILDPDHLPNRVVGDAIRLSQILINLLSNAVKFTEHGWIRLRGQVQAELGRRVHLRFEVQDTGPGIALAAQGALFGAFEQADSSISRQHGGTGLGLALSRQLARAMGGDAGVTSAPGSGSLFWFDVWLTLGVQLPQRFAALQMQGQRALLVDDLPESLSVIGERLQMMGLTVDALDSGNAALAKMRVEVAAGRPYDVMVIDWRMEPLDGIETLNRLRGLLGEGIPPAILVTAFDDQGLAQRARDAGFGAVVLKPVTNSSMHDALARVLSRLQDEVAPAPAVSEGEVEVRAQHTGRRVLLAEDNPVNREVAEQLLESAGLVVETAADGARAVEMALARHYDLMLMDVQMPIMDGLEAAREIRERKGHQTPIIAMTANAFAEDRSASLAAGMNDHLTKPVDPAQLYATLLRWLPIRKPAWSDSTNSAFDGVSSDDLVERLAAVKGINLEAALRHVAGRVNVLARAMLRFAETYVEGLPTLLDTQGDAAAWRARWGVVCHSMRGALSVIGAQALLAEVGVLGEGLSADPLPSTLAHQGVKVHEGVLDLARRLREALE